MKHLEILDQIFEDYPLTEDKKPEVEKLLIELSEAKDYGIYDMVLCKLESILKERGTVD